MPIPFLTRDHQDVINMLLIQEAKQIEICNKLVQLLNKINNTNMPLFSMPPAKINDVSPSHEFPTIPKSRAALHVDPASNDVHHQCPNFVVLPDDSAREISSTKVKTYYM
jgi:hypothetical protein